MNPSQGNESGVSEVVGEMLMIALVVVLISGFSIALYLYLPTDREPSITLIMTDDTRGNVTLWHKGGDWVDAESLSVILMNDTGRRNYQYNLTFNNEKTQFLLVHPNRQAKKVFDLGSNITVRIPEDIWASEDIRRNMSVKLVTPKSIIFTGRIDP